MALGRQVERTGAGVVALGQGHQPVGQVGHVPDPRAGRSGIDVDQSGELVGLIEDHVLRGDVVQADHLRRLVRRELPDGSGGIEARACLVELR